MGKIGKGGRKIKYPWGEWLAASKVELLFGTDYTCSTLTMITQVRTYFNDRGYRCKVAPITGGIRVEITGKHDANE